MTYRIKVTESARREYLHLPRSVQRLFQATLTELSRNPHRRTPDLDIHQLRGGRGLWTLRVGRYRGLYRIEGNCVVFVTFRLRPGAYKELEGI